MDNNIVIVPLDKLREIINSAVSESLEKILSTSHPTKREQESVDIDGALEFLNSNGYRIAKGQLYKETSSGNIPFHKFGHRLHFRISELRKWAEMRLTTGNPVGYLDYIEDKRH